MVTSAIKGGSGTISLNVSLFYHLITRGGLFFLSLDNKGGMFDQKCGKWEQRGLVAVQAFFEKDWLRLFSAGFKFYSSFPEWDDAQRKINRPKMAQNVKYNLWIQQSMASDKKGDAKEEIMEPRSTSVWEVGITFLLFSNVKSRALLYIDEIVTIIQPCRKPHQTNAVREVRPTCSKSL